MKKEDIYFIITIGLIILVGSSLSWFTYSSDKDTMEKLVTAANELNSKINANQQQVNEKISLLEDKLNISMQNISQTQEKLSSVEQQSQAGIQDIYGQLQESEERVSGIESELLNINVQSEGFTMIINKVIKSVVSIKTNLGQGSGVIVDRDGYIVTNYHVIDGISGAGVTTYDGKLHKVSFVGSIPGKDLAVLKIKSDAYPGLPFGSSDRLVIGERVIALGNPAGLEFTVTEGIISSKERQDSRGNNYIQSDITINKGNSGGPLVNAKGEIVGINTLKMTGVEGIGFAIPSDIVEDIVVPMIEQTKEKLEAQAQQQTQ
jgi:S1-C subfamily serine protease